MSAGLRRVAVLGLGEAGSEIAADLVAAGVEVQGYDPIAERGAPPGATDCASEADAVAGTDLVLSVNSAHDAEAALTAGLHRAASAGAEEHRAEAGLLWADLNTASPAAKRRLGQLAAAGGADFADVAMMTPVPGRGVRTPMLVSGPGAGRFAELVAALGTPVTVVDGPPGAAAQRKLLRSVFYKGMAAAVVEALSAARAAGLEGWMRDHLRAELTAADAALVDRLEQGSVRHARRRAEEMAAAGAMLVDLGVPYPICAASESWLRRLDAADPDPPASGG